MEGRRMRGPAERSAQVDVREQRRPAMSRLPSRAEACRIPASREHLHVLPGGGRRAPGSGEMRRAGPAVGGEPRTHRAGLSAQSSAPGLGGRSLARTHISSDASPPRRLFNLPRT